MGQFSDDGQWWWDGTQWIATSQVVLWDLPMTEFEQSGKLKAARSFMRNGSLLLWANTFFLVAVALFVPVLRALRDYRSWRLEQLALATAYLLGPNEAMLAGETSVSDFPITRNYVRRDLAVAVTAAHVLVFCIDFLDGQPRWIVLAGRSTDVSMELRTGAFGLYRALTISRRHEQWAIRGSPLMFTGFKPKPVLEAWRLAATTTASTKP